jgi:hypothetical protein
MNFKPEILDSFGHIDFNEEKHLYTIGDQKLTSVTTLIKQFEEEKDWVEIAYNYSLKNGETPEYWLEKWGQEQTIGGEKGSEFHLYAEGWMKDEKYPLKGDMLDFITELNPLPEIDVRKAVARLRCMFDLFWLEASKNLIPLRSEHIVGCAELGVAGMIDQLFWNKKMKELQVWDWKTSKKIATSNKYNKFLAPIGHLDECEYIKYSLQISIYKHILQKILGITVGSCYIGWFYENNESYKIMKARDLNKEAELILQAA